MSFAFYTSAADIDTIKENVWITRRCRPPVHIPREVGSTVDIEFLLDNIQIVSVLCFELFYVRARLLYTRPIEWFEPITACCMIRHTHSSDVRVLHWSIIALEVSPG